jgi:hypothetical protein
MLMPAAENEYAKVSLISTGRGQRAQDLPARSFRCR